MNPLAMFITTRFTLTTKDRFLSQAESRWILPGARQLCFRWTEKRFGQPTLSSPTYQQANYSRCIHFRRSLSRRHSPSPTVRAKNPAIYLLCGTSPTLATFLPVRNWLMASLENLTVAQGGRTIFYYRRWTGPQAHSPS